ncbi:MAG: adenylate/guanylate cyclase domain-containing protein [Pseudomonadales bacterium]|nr:adenylate/guanylate cyclase domain-containing protein [Pseudomonadales bacterium]
MTQTSTNIMTILFADVAGSTTLYEKMGDNVAQQMIGRCLKFMTEICHQHDGVLVKNIGDEILCRFDSALDCVRAISKIQSDLQEEVELSNGKLRIRAGMNTGPAILDENDVFGDAVNVAARMAGIAQESQVLCTSETINALGDDHNISFRQLDSLLVKGKQAKINVYEVLWDSDDVDITAFFSAQELLEQTQEWKVNLTCGSKRMQINKSQPNAVVGRSDQCDFVVPSPHASRQHAKLISRWGKLVLVDQSTNGTYVKFESGVEMFIRREELPLTENGIISLGIPSAQNPRDVLFFNYENRFSEVT